MTCMSEEGAISVLPFATPPLEDIYSVPQNWLLGKGEYGIVRKCMHNQTGKTYACKSMDKRRILQSNRFEDLEMELYGMGVLPKHPYIVHLSSVHEDNEHVHMVMDLCEGGDLFEFVQQMGKLSEIVACSIIRQILHALSFCHAHGFAHLDIKPENILVMDSLDEHFSGVAASYAQRQVQTDQENERAQQVADYALAHAVHVKLADFGQAVLLQPGQKARGLAGSSFYMAPEVVQGKSYDTSADMWSLGVLLYALLSGFVPFWGETVEQTFSAICGREPNLEMEPWTGISKEAKALVSALLSIDPKGRPTAFQALNHAWVHKFSIANFYPLKLPHSLSSSPWPSHKGFSVLAEEEEQRREGHADAEPSPRPAAGGSLKPFNFSSANLTNSSEQVASGQDRGEYLNAHGASSGFSGSVLHPAGSPAKKHSFLATENQQQHHSNAGLKGGGFLAHHHSGVSSRSSSGFSSPNNFSPAASPRNKMNSLQVHPPQFHPPSSAFQGQQQHFQLQQQSQQAQRAPAVDQANPSQFFRPYTSQQQPQPAQTAAAHPFAPSNGSSRVKFLQDGLYKSYFQQQQQQHSQLQGPPLQEASLSSSLFSDPSSISQNRNLSFSSSGHLSPTTEDVAFEDAFEATEHGYIHAPSAGGNKFPSLALSLGPFATPSGGLPANPTESTSFVDPTAEMDFSERMIEDMITEQRLSIRRQKRAVRQKKREAHKKNRSSSSFGSNCSNQSSLCSSPNVFPNSPLSGSGGSGLWDAPSSLEEHAFSPLAREAMLAAVNQQVKFQLQQKSSIQEIQECLH